jgi:hypothetical protein
MKCYLPWIIVALLLIALILAAKTTVVVHHTTEVHVGQVVIGRIQPTVTLNEKGKEVNTPWARDGLNRKPSGLELPPSVPP